MATALTVVKITLVLGVALGAFLLADGSFRHFAGSGAEGTCEGVPETAHGGLRGFGAAMLGALWGYNGWNVVAAVMSAGLMVSAYGTMHSTLLTGPRFPFALASGGLLPAGLGQVSARGVPATSVLTVGAWSLVLALTGTFDILTDIYIFVL